MALRDHGRCPDGLEQDAGCHAVELREVLIGDDVNPPEFDDLRLGKNLDFGRRLARFLPPLLSRQTDAGPGAVTTSMRGTFLNH